MSLAAARKARDVAKAQEASGINPMQARQIVKLKAAVNTGDPFRETALELFDKHHARICARTLLLVASAKLKPLSCWRPCAVSRSVACWRRPESEPVMRVAGVTPCGWTTGLIRTKQPSEQVGIRIRWVEDSRAQSEAALRCRPLQ